MADQEREGRIRQRAYHLWLAEGCPNGRDLEHWRAAEQAEAEAEAAQAARTGATARD